MEGRARPSGPFLSIDLGGVSVPLWVIEFGKDGACLNPKTRELLLADVAKHDYTDIFLFAHGWNNTFGRAAAVYEKFIVGYHRLQQANELRTPHPYRPLLVGMFWPSIALLLPREKAPRIAGGPAGESEAGGDGAAISEVAASLEPDTKARFTSLAARSDLTNDEARELAGLLAQAYPADDEVDPEDPGPTADDVMGTWSSLVEAGLTGAGTSESGPDSFGVADEDQDLAAGPAAAGGLSSLVHFDPRDIVRAFTVYKMKDRAGVVGAAGGAEILSDLLKAGAQARLRLIGHSYGGRLLLSAICSGALPREVQSLLLLEPAVNYLCFAGQVPKRRRPGGFRGAMGRVKQPIMTTFSANDAALHDFFHLAVRRKKDLGEVAIAALGVVPSIYAALGGWGPGGLDAGEVAELPLTRYPNRYATTDTTCRVYALNGTVGITSHSDVINDWTYWALYNQVMAGE